MDHSVQRIDTTPIQPVAQRKQRNDEQAAEFERELEEAHGESKPGSTSESTPAADSPVAPRLDDEAGGSLDLTA